MKFFLYLLLACMSCFTARAQVQSSCSPSPDLQTTYGNDIAHLALMRMYAIQSADTQLIDIPAVHQDSVRKAMAAVYNLGSQLEADSVMRRHCIHADVNNNFDLHPSLARNGVILEVKVDPAMSWTNGWRNLQITTGYTALDALMTQYGFVIEHYSLLDDQVRIKSTRVINGFAFADSLRKFDGIEDTRSVANFGDGNNIVYQYDNGAGYLSFRLGWGDCPLGCTSNKYWHYRVDGQCRVTLDSVRIYRIDQAYPIPNNCGVTAIKDPAAAISFVIYPNPATDIVSLSVNGNETYSYKLTDSYGRLLLEGAVKGTTSLPLTSFAKGLYWLQVTDRKGNRANKKLLLQ